MEEFDFTFPTNWEVIPSHPAPKPTEADLLKSLREKGMNFSGYSELESKVWNIRVKGELNETLTEDELALREQSEFWCVMDEIQRQIDYETPSIYINGDVFTPAEYDEYVKVHESELEEEAEFSRCH